MFKNNFFLILRNIRNSKTITLINVIGLTLGLAASILLMVLVKYEYSFDKFHKNKNTIQRVISIINKEDSNEKVYLPGVPSVLGEYLKENIPEIKNSVSITANGPALKIGETLYDEKALYVDNNFLNIFSFNLIEGDPQKALNEPANIILTKSFANKIFGNKDVYNQTITINNKNYKIAGVLEDIPKNSSIQFSALFPLNSNSTYNQLIDHWGNNFTAVYINLPENLDRESLQSTINKLSKTFERPGALTQFALQPLSRIHLFSQRDYNIAGKGNITNLIIYSFFVFFLLATAIINYTNISFNQIYRRSSEIGMRRILGASKLHIFYRNWLESIIICAGSFLLSLLVVSAVLPEFNSLFDRQIEFSYIWGDILEIAIILLAVSFLLGLLPTLKLIKASNPRSLKNNVEFSNSNKTVKGMLVAQFAITFFFLITAFLVSDQLSFINSEYSINENEDIIHVRNTREKEAAQKGTNLFYNAVAENSVVMNSTFMEGSGRRGAYYLGEFSAYDHKEYCHIEKIEKNNFSMFGRKILAGRSLDPETFRSDTINSAMVNETFLKVFDIKDPLNAVITEGEKKYKIVGVVEDYAMLSLKYEVEPLVLLPVKKVTDFYFKVAKANEKQALNLIERKWKEFYPHQTLSYVFYSESVMQDYNDEIIAHKLFLILSFISISLSLLGTLGLLSLMLAKKKKEIAIRKVLGASVQNLIMHFSKEFTIVIALGFIIASALSYNYINKFLEDFAYKIAINSTPFIIAFIVVLMVVWGAVAVQSLKSLYTNPVESLRSE